MLPTLNATLSGTVTTNPEYEKAVVKHEIIRIKILSQLAPCTYLLAEEGITVPVVPINLGAKEQFSDAYVAFNPNFHAFRGEGSWPM